MLVFSVMRERGLLKIYYNYRRREEAPIQVPKCSWTHDGLSRRKKGIVTPWDRQLDIRRELSYNLLNCKGNDMGYDPRAVKVKKAEKVVAIMSLNRERERHFIREAVKSSERNARVRSAKNKGDKEE